MEFLHFFGLLNLKDSVLDVDEPRLERMFGWSSPDTESVIARQRMRVRLLKYAHDKDPKTLERLSSNRRMFALAHGISVQGTRKGTGIPFPSEQDIAFNICLLNVSSAALEMTSHMTKKVFRVPFDRTSKNSFVLKTYLPLCLMRRISTVVKFDPEGSDIPILRYDGLIFEDRPLVDFTPDSRSTLVNAPAPDDSSKPPSIEFFAPELHIPAEYSSIDLNGSDKLERIRATEPLDFEVNGIRYQIKDHDIRQVRPRSMYA